MGLRFEKVMSWPIALVDISRPIMLVAISRSNIPWFIMSEDLYKEDIWLFLGPMACEVMSMRLPFLSSMSELESMYEVIVVLIRSGSTEGSALASRLIYLPVLSAVSLRMWNPWSSAT